jgi:hypothetical protein
MREAVGAAGVSSTAGAGSTAISMAGGWASASAEVGVTMAVSALGPEDAALQAASRARSGRHAAKRIIAVSECPAGIKSRARARAKHHDAAIKE